LDWIGGGFGARHQHPASPLARCRWAARLCLSPDGGDPPKSTNQAAKLLFEAAPAHRAAAERVAGFLRDYARFLDRRRSCPAGTLSRSGAYRAADTVILEMALSSREGHRRCSHAATTGREVLGPTSRPVLSVRIPQRASVEFGLPEDRRSATLDLGTAVGTAG